MTRQLGSRPMLLAIFQKTSREQADLPYFCLVHLLITPYHDMPPVPGHEILSSLNAAELNRLNSYHGRERMQRLLGLDLLNRQLRYFQEPLLLSELCRTPYNKPYFKDTAFDFSISHAKDYVVCLASGSVRVGVDIEFEDAALADADSDFLSPAEKASLQGHLSTKQFYHLHTRKEALAKALGQGIFLNHHDFDVAQDTVQANGSAWHFNSFRLEERYTVSCVSDRREPLKTTVIGA